MPQILRNLSTAILNESNLLKAKDFYDTPINMRAILIIIEDHPVAPTGSRLYRRLAIGQRLKKAKRAASPRYSRLPVGATSALPRPASWKKKSAQRSSVLPRRLADSSKSTGSRLQATTPGGRSRGGEWAAMGGYGRSWAPKEYNTNHNC